MVHGDDYVSAGIECDLLWFERMLMETREINTQKIGPWTSGGASEGKVLNRTLRWSREAWEVEADPRHAELLVEQLDVEGARILSMPGAEDDDKDSDADKVPLAGADITLYRGPAARCNYLSLNRPDIQYGATPPRWSAA